MTTLTAPARQAAAAPGTTPRRPRHRTLGSVGSHAFLGLLTLAFLAPVVWAVISAFKPAGQIVSSPLSLDPSRLTVHNFTAMFSDVPIGRGFVNTLIVLAVKGSMTMFFAPLAAYGFAKYRFPLRDALFGTVLVTLMLPTIVLIIPLLLEMKEPRLGQHVPGADPAWGGRRVRHLLDAAGDRGGSRRA